MPSKENPQALVQKQKLCPAVSTTPTRLHWVTIKPYSKVYLSSLKGSALTLGVSIDLGNTVPSAPEITKQNRRQIVNIISCYQGSDCQIIPRCNLHHCLSPCLSCTSLLSPEKPDLVHLQWVACKLHFWLEKQLLALQLGESLLTQLMQEAWKRHPLLTSHLIQLHPTLMTLDACHDMISFAGLSEILKGEKHIFIWSLQTPLQSGCAPAWEKGRCTLMQGSSSRLCSSPSLATSSMCDPETI